MKKVILKLFCILALLFVLPVTARADMGPKPSVIIDFTGLEEETYYVTLLSEAKTTGPYSALTESNKEYSRYQEGDEGYDVFLKFAEYRDTDGYYFLQYFEDCSGSHRFSWTYYPPQKFKILVFFPEADAFAVSDDVYERYAFDSYFSAEVTGMDLSGTTPGVWKVVAKKAYDHTYEIVSLVARILLTIAVELGIALLFGFREKKQFRFIAVVNVMTQVGLNIALNMINYSIGQLAFVFFYVLLEIVVIIAEAVLYAIYLKKFGEKPVSRWKPIAYALVSNVSSFALGLGIARWIPGIF
jgi:hypothetical protein